MKQGAPQIKTFETAADYLEGKLPVYIAHLFGNPALKDFHFAGFTLTSTSTKPEDVTVITELQGYSSPSTSSFHINSNQSVDGTSGSTFDWNALCSISSPVVATADIKLYRSGQSGEPIDLKFTSGKVEEV